MKPQLSIAFDYFSLKNIADRLILPFCATIIVAGALICHNWHCAFGGTAIFAIIAALYRHCGFRSPLAATILSAAIGLSFCGACANIWWFTMSHNCTATSPFLANWDASTDWATALHIVVGTPYPDNIRNYGVLLGGLMQITGVNVAVPILFNVLCYGLLLLVMGKIGSLLSDSDLFPAIFILVTAAMNYLMVQSTIIIKDVPITMCMAIVVWRIVAIALDKDRLKGPINVFCTVCALAMLAFLRPNFMLFIILGSFIVALGMRNRRVVIAMTLIAIASISFMLLSQYAPMKLTGAMDIIQVQTSEYHQLFAPNTIAWDNLTGRYDSIPLLHKLMWLPASVAVQFLIPLPWNYANYTDYGLTMPWAHMGFSWYFAVALALYFMVKGIKLFLRSGTMSASYQIVMLLAVWGALCTIITAYLTAGHVSRYCLPYLPLILPATAMTISDFSNRKSLKIWLGIFTILILTALTIAYLMQ